MPVNGLGRRRAPPPIWARPWVRGYDAGVDPSPLSRPADLLRRNLAGLAGRVAAARARGPHAASEVQILVVTKSMPAGIFGPLAGAGVQHVAENRVQAAQARRPLAPPGLTWHGIGHVQRNKAAGAVAAFDVFHALDSLRLADALEAELEQAGRTWPVYVQVNTAEDPAKGGFTPGNALTALAALAERPHLQPAGFMTMAAWGAEDADLRSTFSTLREIRNEALRLGRGRTAPAGLSMGMSDDFEIAVEEGATVVRIGRAVFEGVDLPAPPKASSEGAPPARAPDEGRGAPSPMEPS